VRSGRAIWLEEGHTLQLTPESDILTPAIIEEETEMDEKITNGKAEAYSSDHTEESDDLLMYLAKKNVREKRNLGWHALAFIIAFIVVGMLFGANTGSRHPMSGWARDAAWNLETTIPHIPENYAWPAYDAIQVIENIVHNYTPPILHMLSGALLLWGAWIIVCAAKIFRRKNKSAKPDPVLLEYKRLKDTIDLR